MGRATIAVLGGAALAAGCGAGEVAVPDAGAAPIVTITVPPTELAPGVELALCYYAEIELEEGVAVARWESESTVATHGLEVFGTTVPVEPAGTLVVPCRLAGPTLAHHPRWLYGAELRNDASDLPRGVGLVLAARQPLIVRLHAINTGEVPVAVAATVRLVTTRPGEDFVPAAVYSTFRTDLRLVPDVVSTVSGACPVPAGLDFFRISTLSLRAATLTEVADDDGRLFRSTAPIHAGEVSWLDPPRTLNGPLRYTCRYLNRSNDVIATGGLEGTDELCMAFGHVVPASADLACVDDVLIDGP